MSLWSNVRYHPDIFLEGLNKLTKGLSHDTQSRTEISTYDPRNMKEDCWTGI
jgi:hypothetical protein